MYAIVEIAGQQFKVEEGKKIFVHRLDAGEGKEIEFDQVLLIEDDGKILIGEPTIKDVVVEGKILDNKVRGEKVIVFKKKRKKGYRVKNGHRQNFTQVEIISIGEKGVPKKSAVKKEVVKPVEESVKEKKTAEKTAETKKPAAKKKAVSDEKPSAKKAAERKSALKKPAGKKTGKGKE
jgi:large subunit ribosomal protein L21